MLNKKIRINWLRTGDENVDLVKELCNIKPGFVPAPDHANLVIMVGRPKFVQAKPTYKFGEYVATYESNRLRRIKDAKTRYKEKDVVRKTR